MASGFQILGQDGATNLKVDATPGAARVLLYDSAGNPSVLADKATIPANQGGNMMLARDYAVGRIPRASSIGNLQTGYDAVLFADPVEGATLHSLLWTSTATGAMAETQANRVITMNSGAITTIATAIQHMSVPLFMKLTRAPLLFRCGVKQAHQNNAVFEFGFLTGALGVTVLVPNGVFFRRKTDGTMVGVISFNSTEVETANMTVPNATSYYEYEIFVEDNRVRFLVFDSTGIPIVDTWKENTLTQPDIWNASHMGCGARVYNNTAPASAAQLFMTSTIVTSMDADINVPYEAIQAGNSLASTVTPLTYASSADYANSAAPASSTPTNTTATRTTLGGQWLVPAMAGGETDLALFSFTVPSPYNLFVTSIMISPPVNGVVAVATTANLVQWGLGVNVATANLSTGGGQRIVLPGWHTAAIALAVNLPFSGNPIIYTPKVPLVTYAGRFFIVIFKMITGAATATETFRGTVVVDGYLR